VQINSKINCIVVRARRHDLHNWSGYSSHSRGIMGVPTRVIWQLLAHAPVVAYPVSNRLTIRCDATNCVCPSCIMADTMAVHVPHTIFCFHRRNPFAGNRVKVAVWPGRLFFSRASVNASMNVNEVLLFRENRIVPSLERYFARSLS